jgi:hypothetical protein
LVNSRNFVIRLSGTCLPSRGSNNSIFIRLGDLLMTSSRRIFSFQQRIV